MRMLLAVDGSDFTKKMLAYLAAHETWLSPGTEVSVVHAVPPVPPRAAAVLDRDVLKGYYAEEAEKVLKPIRAFLKRHGISPKEYKAAGPAADMVIKAAKDADADLIVIGSHGRSSIANVVMGSVVTKVLAGSTVPVMVVR